MSDSADDFPAFLGLTVVVLLSATWGRRWQEARDTCDAYIGKVCVSICVLRSPGTFGSGIVARRLSPDRSSWAARYDGVGPASR